MNTGVESRGPSVEGTDEAERALSRIADQGVSRYMQTLSAVAAPSRMFEPEGAESNEQLAAEVRKLRAGVAAGSGSGTPGWGGGESDGTDAPGDGPTDYGELGDPFVPGDASTPGATVTAEVRTRGGTATLVGHSEYTTPSTPPEKYLVETATGSAVSNRYSLAGCTGAILDTLTCTLSGQNAYSRTTGVLISTASSTCGGGAPTGPLVTVCGRDVVTTRTTSQSMLDMAACCPGIIRSTADSYSLTLSDLDTEADAVARLLATSPSWSSFAACGAYPCASAVWAARTSGFSFAYGEAELRLTFAGMPAGWLFSAKVTLTRVSAATSEVSVVEVQTYEATPDGSGDAEITVSVEPEEPGYTYRVEKVVFVR